MSKRKGKPPEAMELFDPTPYFVEPEHDDTEGFWVPPATVHNFGARSLFDLVTDGATAGVTRMLPPPKSTNRIGGMVVRFETGGYPSLIRIRDARKLDGDGHDARLYQVTLRRYTASGAPAAEWTRMLNGDFWRYGYAWADLADDDLTLRYAVVLDADELALDLEPGARPGVLVRNPKDGKDLFRAPGGERFHAIDLRHLRPKTVTATYGFTIAHVEPDPVLM